uniref:Uncharacterized protein n=1 Tax=Trypanosoma vivax (strain Y486) TaxID=1055687 RepID=G0U4T5_TRYVY|nr:hypothetical protein TVY486_1014930 [Trypanosoma vivax Y486]
MCRLCTLRTSVIIACGSVCLRVSYRGSLHSPYHRVFLVAFHRVVLMCSCIGRVILSVNHKRALIIPVFCGRPCGLAMFVVFMLYTYFLVQLSLLSTPPTRVIAFYCILV